jgi:N-sulfoglucosamine sulfohydrolase
MRSLCTIICIVFVSHALIAQNNTKPNILWISFEDTGLDFSMYGDHLAKTPHIDALAKESTIYENAFSTTGVCAPSRSAIITGMHPTSLGTIHMRTGNPASPLWKNLDFLEQRYDLANQPIHAYSAVIPDGVKCLTQILRSNGYYCTNDSKTDYQFEVPFTAWDESKDGASWKNKKSNQPFFAVINSIITHESNLFRNIARPLTVDPKTVVVPPYLPDTDSMRFMIARHYSNIELLDKKVGEIINKLREDGLYDDTIIFFFSDHGGPFPREKREVYDSGIRVPLLIKIPGHKSQRKKDMVSLIDLAPTVLELAKIPIPRYMEGSSLLKKRKGEYIMAHGDRFDEWSDRVRAIRSQRYLYIENKIDGKTGYKDVAYRKSIYGMHELLASAKDNKLNRSQQQWFEIKPPAELYDVDADPYQINNIISDIKYKNIVNKMKNEMDKFYKKHGDQGAIPEAQLIKKMWPTGQHPVTNMPSITKTNDGYLTASCSTQSSTIGYIITDAPLTTIDYKHSYQIYNTPIKIVKGKYYNFFAERVGYKVSQIATLNPNP